MTGAECPYVVDESKADFYPIQPSFSAGYMMSVQKLNSDTADWAYEVKGDFPYSNWTAWYLYDLKGVPLYKFSDATITPDAGLDQPVRAGQPGAGPGAQLHPLLHAGHDPPSSVVSQMQAEGKNVALLPAVGSTDGVSIVVAQLLVVRQRRPRRLRPVRLRRPDRHAVPDHRGRHHRSDAPVSSPTPRSSDCGAQSELPQKLWYDREHRQAGDHLRERPAAHATAARRRPAEVPGPDRVGLGHAGRRVPAVAGRRTRCSSTGTSRAIAPYADVQSAPPQGNPPDACGGYVMANLPNDVVSLVHIPQVPSFPDYEGATDDHHERPRRVRRAVLQRRDLRRRPSSSTPYGTDRELPARQQPDHRRTPTAAPPFVLYPQSAPASEQVDQIAAVAKANGWNLLQQRRADRPGPEPAGHPREGPEPQLDQRARAPTT